MAERVMTPRAGDHVYNTSRADRRLMPHGYVIRVRAFKWGEERTCMVKYFKPNRIFAQADPEFGYEGGDYDTMTFEEFDEYRMSSELPEGTFKDYRRRTYHEAEGCVDD